MGWAHGQQLRCAQPTFVLAGGEVEVARRDASDEVKAIATVEPDQFFGEMSLKVPASRPAPPASAPAS